MSGKIHRIKSTDNFVVLQKTVLQDENLSWKAKGLHCYLMQLPADWQINVADLSNRSKDGRDATASALYELQKAGYLKRTKISDQGGKFAGYDYEVHEVKISTINGKTVNGFSVNGLSVNGKPVTTKNYLNKELIEVRTNNKVVEGEKKFSLESNLEQALKTEKENLEGGAPAAGAAIEKTIEALKENEFVREAFARVSRVPVEKYFEYLEEFKIKCRAEQAKHTNEGDTRKHFLNWARIRYQSESNNQKNTTNANYSKPNRKDPEQARRDAFARTLAILDFKGD
jgi:hypothetical protein